jgi:hypothetical protein
MIALSDGKKPVTLTLRLKDATNSPDVALSGGQLVSVEKEDESTLVVTVVPSRGSWDTRLVLASGTEVIDYALIVAPPVDMPGSINEKNFVAELNKFVSDEGRKERDVNRSFLYKYIFTANYLTRVTNAFVVNGVPAGSSVARVGVKHS